jgi:hypothetical protein
VAGLRHALIAALAVTPGVLGARATRAQGCHAEPPQQVGDSRWQLTLGQETARFESPRYEGHYQGLRLSGGVGRQRLYAGAALAAYRIVRNGLPGRGVGDLLLHSRVLLLRAEHDRARAGVGLGVTLPTGDARADLGMGHVMLMPGAWASAQLNQILASAQLTYGKSLRGNNAAHHHDSVGPLVAPMSGSELEATASASLPIYPKAAGARARASVNGALPVLDESGAARADLRLALLFGDRVNTSLELHLPITGSPSTLKLVVALSIGVR